MASHGEFLSVRASVSGVQFDELEKSANQNDGRESQPFLLSHRDSGSQQLKVCSWCSIVCSFCMTGFGDVDTENLVPPTPVLLTAKQTTNSTYFRILHI